MKQKIKDCVEVFDTFIKNLEIVLNSSKTINGLMNVGYAEDYETSMEQLIGFLGEQKTKFGKLHGVFNDRFLKLFEYHSKDSQKFINVRLLVLNVYIFMETITILLVCAIILMFKVPEQNQRHTKKTAFIKK